MSLENVRYGRVLQAVMLVLVASMGLWFLFSCLLVPFIPQEMATRFSDFFQLAVDPDTSPDQANAELQDLIHDYGATINLMYGAQWTLITLITFGIARRTARQADSPEQAVGYGILVGLGVVFSYGLLCVLLLSLASPILQFTFFVLFFAAGYLGGRAGSRRLLPPGTAVPPLLPGFGRPTPSPTPSPGGYSGRTTGENPDTFYNMGIMAALGGRRDEARQHFTRVLQMQPRHVSAWLQLANLSDTPEQAWNYIQQARAISPNEPAVKQAVEVIWPQVAANAARQGPPRAQAPFLGPAVPTTQPPVSPDTGPADESAVPPPSTLIPPPGAGPEN